MNKICPMEKSILSALAAGRLDGSLTGHLSICAYCQDSLAISKWMGQLAAIPVESAPPDLEVIWMMSRITQSSRRAAIPAWDGIAAILFAALIAVWIWSPVESLVTKIVPVHSMLLVLFLVSCTIAAGMTLVALNTESLFLRRQ